MLRRGLERGFNVDYQGEADLTLLYLAAGINTIDLRKIDLIKALLKANANPNFATDRGYSPLYAAV